MQIIQGFLWYKGNRCCRCQEDIFCDMIVECSQAGLAKLALFHGGLLTNLSIYS